MIVRGYYGHLWLVWAVLTIIELYGALVLSMIFMVLYVLGSYVNCRLGKKFAVGSFAEFLIPVYGTMLLCDCAKVSRWLTAFFVLPLLFGRFGSLAVICVIVSYMFLYGKIARRLGRNPWIWGVIYAVLFGLTAPICFVMDALWIWLIILGFFLGIPIMIMALDNSMPMDGEKVKNSGNNNQGPRYINI